MTTRMERYHKRKKKKSRKKTKFMIVVLLVAVVVFKINSLNNTLRKSTDTEDHNLYEISKTGSSYTVQLLGKAYYIDRKQIGDAVYIVKQKLANTYETIIGYKEKILNK